MFEPLRFFHVADAALDRPLTGLDSLPEPLQILGEDATLLAYDTMIDGAIAHEVDFVLLGGNTFCDNDQSLRARLRLVDGFHRLEEQGISVYVLPAETDSASSWESLPELPANVTIITERNSSQSNPVRVSRNARVIATLHLVSLREPVDAANREPEEEKPSDSEASSGEATPSEVFRIGMLGAWPSWPLSISANDADLGRQLSKCECDYLAVPAASASEKARGWRFDPGQTINTNDGIAHHPGPLQSLSEREIGPHGATLIDVDEAGEIKGTFLPFAAVRRLCISLPFDSATALEDLAEVMEAKLAEESEPSGEEAWFMTWIVQGRDIDLEALRTLVRQKQLVSLLPKQHPASESVSLHHRLKLQEAPTLLEDMERFSELERLFRQSLHNSFANNPEILPSLAGDILADLHSLASSDANDLLNSSIFELELDDVLEEAISLGHDWFGDEDEG